MQGSSGACPVILRGPGCSETVALPKCIKGRFKGSWLTLSKPAVGASDSFTVGQDISEETVSKLPSFDVFGSASLPFRVQALPATQPLVHHAHAKAPHAHLRACSNTRLVCRSRGP